MSVGDFHGLQSRTSNRPQPSERPLESSTVLEPVAIVARLIVSVPLYVTIELGQYRIDLLNSVGCLFSAAHFFWALLQAKQSVLSNAA